MRVKRLLYALGFFLIVQTVSAGFPSSCGALTWGYPPGSSLAECLANEMFTTLVFPDRGSAVAALEADYAAVQALCAAAPSPKPSYCSNLEYWEWGCTWCLDCPPCCSSTSGCFYFCPGVTNCGFTCKNCRDPGWDPEQNYWRKTNYWYYICGPGSPPTQQPDPPITTEMTDRNAGGGCAGTCDITVGGQGMR